jgi:acetyl-CoA C-acetyltransferase
MSEAVIISACRTPIGRYGKSLMGFSSTQLGAIAIKEAVARARVNPVEIDEVIMGNVVTAGLGQAPARQAALAGGIPDSVPAFTVNKVCASGLKAVGVAADAIKAGSAETIVAGGMESMSNAPYVVRELRWGSKMNDVKLVDAMVYDGLWDVYSNFHMGMTGEIVADRYNVTREDMDRFSYESHMKANRATQDGKFKAEIVPVELKAEKRMFEQDEGIRSDSTVEKLAKLPAAFKKDGKVTAGNASQLSDGGAATVVMSSEAAMKKGFKPLARIVDYVSAGVKPEWVMEAPIPAVRKLLKKTGLEVKDIDLWEHNEAFSSASVAVMKELGIPRERFNVNGGAVALGHPIGCSGARILATLIYAMKDRNARRGVVTICLGGGNAMAMLIENM